MATLVLISTKRIRSSQFDAGQDGKDKFSRIAIADQGDFPIEEKRKANEAIQKLPPNEQAAAWKKFFAAHRHDVNRLVLGRSRDGSVGLDLRDQNGKVRIVLTVLENGQPVFQFLDQDGKVVRDLRGSDK